MANVRDGISNWPCTVDGIQTGIINVTMGGKNGYDAVCTGLPRSGSVETDEGNAYNVKLPGTFTPHTLKVSFKRS